LKGRSYGVEMNCFCWSIFSVIELICVVSVLSLGKFVFRNAT